MERNKISRKLIVVIIAIIVGLLHFITGHSYTGPFPILVNGYMIDILLPFAMFLVLGVAKQNFFRTTISKSFLVFTIGAVSETLQYFGVPIFGRTFDLFDYLMFIIGIFLAYIFEKTVLLKFPLFLSDQAKDK